MLEPKKLLTIYDLVELQFDRTMMADHNIYKNRYVDNVLYEFSYFTKDPKSDLMKSVYKRTGELSAKTILEAMQHNYKVISELFNDYYKFFEIKDLRGLIANKYNRQSMYYLSKFKAYENLKKNANTIAQFHYRHLNTFIKYGAVNEDFLKNYNALDLKEEFTIIAENMLTFYLESELLKFLEYIN